MANNWTCADIEHITSRRSGEAKYDTPIFVIIGKLEN